MTPTQIYNLPAYAVYQIICLFAFILWAAWRKAKSMRRPDPRTTMVTYDCKIIPRPKNTFHHPCVHHTVKVVDPEEDLRTWLEFFGDRATRYKKSNSDTVIIYDL